MDALENMQSYMKFMKKILANKKKLGEYETIALTEECSAMTDPLPNDRKSASNSIVTSQPSSLD